MRLIRILYHNVLGYNLTAAGNEVAGRADTMLAIYQEYRPDILCFQELTAAFRNDANAQRLMHWLEQIYHEYCFETPSAEALVNDGGTPTPIFVRKDSGLTVIDAGYIRARVKATKGTTWTVLEDAFGKRFCVSNSHFVSPTEQGPGTDRMLMRNYRTADANAWLERLSAILKDYPQIPVISGGDFNAGREYPEPNGGALTPWEWFVRRGYTDIRGEGNGSIDHALCMGDNMTAAYWVLPGGEDAWGSDHAPHYADIIVHGSREPGDQSDGSPAICSAPDCDA